MYSKGDYSFTWAVLLYNMNYISKIFHKKNDFKMVHFFVPKYCHMAVTMKVIY